MRSFGSARGRRLRLLLCVSLLAWTGSTRGVDDKPWRVLVLTVDLTVPTNVEILDEIRDTLRSGAPRPVDVLVESLDDFRFPVDRVDRETAALLRKKYAQTKLDLIVSLGSATHAFLGRHRDKIWPGVPVVASALRRSAFESTPLDGTRAVLLDIDIRATLGLALALHPAAKHVAAISGTGAYEARWHDEIVNVVREFADRLDFIDLTGRSVEDIEEGVRALPPDSVVLFFPVTAVPSGMSPGSLPMARRVAKVSSAPIYTMFESAVGWGLVGGVAPDFDEHAKAAGKLALEVLSGTAPAATVRTTPPARCIVDARALNRWRIDEALLPANCEVRFTPPSWLEKNLASAVVLIAIALQLALIALVVVFRRRSRRVAMELERQREAAVHTARLATVGELVASITHELSQPLGTIRTNIDSAELLIASQRAGWLDELRATLGDIRRDDQRASAVISHIRSLLRRHERESKTIDLNQVVKSAVKLVSIDAQRRRVRIETDLGNLPPVIGDPVQLEQVMLNLALNGMDAMSDTPVRDRVLLIRTRHDRSGGVDLFVSDSGHGVPSDIEAQLFEPFFTTKPRGMGLGLSISRAIVETHGGSIRAENRADAGATIRVSLPEARVEPRQGLVAAASH